MQAAGQIPKVANIVIPSVVAIVAATGVALKQFTIEDDLTGKDFTGEDITGEDMAGEDFVGENEEIDGEVEE